MRERTGALRRANDEIQRQAYIVSHDLRAPLINITGFTREIGEAAETIGKYVAATKDSVAYPEGARVEAAIGEDIPEALRFIRSSLTRMDNLISEILKLSRLGRAALTPVPIDTAELAETCLAFVRRQLDDANGVAVIEGEMPAIVSDRNALQQIFTNLLDNAIKFLEIGAGRPHHHSRQAGAGARPVRGRGQWARDQARRSRTDFRTVPALGRSGQGGGGHRPRACAHARAQARRRHRRRLRRSERNGFSLPRRRRPQETAGRRWM